MGNPYDILANMNVYLQGLRCFIYECSLLGACIGCSLAFAVFVVSVISRQLVAADRALIVLAEPLSDTLLIEEMTAGHAGRLLCQVLAADRAAGKFFLVRRRAAFCNLAVFVSDSDNFKVFNGILTCWGCAGTAALLL